jgi:hypothetical protein
MTETTETKRKISRWFREIRGAAFPKQLKLNEKLVDGFGKSAERNSRNNCDLSP